MTFTKLKNADNVLRYRVKKLRRSRRENRGYRDAEKKKVKGQRG